MGPKPKQTKKTKKQEPVAKQTSDFVPVTFDAKVPTTAILLLESTEKDVLLKAMESLHKFASENYWNIESLYELNIVQPLLRHLSNEDVSIKRTAIRLLAKMAKLPNVKSILCDVGHIRRFISALQEQDPVVHEISTLILAELTADVSGREQFLKEDCLLTIYQMMTSAKFPDIHKNCLQIMCNVLEDVTAVGSLNAFDDWTFAPLIQLFDSEYLAIQTLALKLVEHLGKHSYMRAMFVKSGGLQKILNMLGKYDLSDLHAELFNIIRQYSTTLSDVEYFNSIEGFQKLIDYIRETSTTELKENALEVLKEFAFLDASRSILSKCQVEQTMLSHLWDLNLDVITTAAEGLIEMVKHPAVLETFRRENPVKILVSLLDMEYLPIVLGQAISSLLSILLLCSYEACLTILEKRGLQVIYHILQYDEDDKLAVNLIHCLTSLSVHSDIRTEVVTGTDLMQSLMFRLERGNMDVKVAVCEALCAFMNEPIVREQFLEMSGPFWILKCIDLHNIPVKKAAAALVKIAGRYKKIGLAFLQNGAIRKFLKYKNMKKICTDWNTALQTLYNTDLSAKFAITGRLEPTDITDDIFYTAPCPIGDEKFLLLEEMLDLQVSTRRPIYIANFIPPSITQQCFESEDTDKGNVFYHPEELITVYNHAGCRRHASCIKEDQSIKSKNNNIQSIEEVKRRDTLFEILPFNNLPTLTKLLDDPYLLIYVHEAKLRLGELTGTTEVAKKLAEFVVEKMCGDAPGGDCLNHDIELTMAEIKIQLGTNLIPLGLIKVGSFAERAILFKVLADRVGFPCALVRGSFGRTWVEVTILPQDSYGYPTDRIRPNHIVDLMYNVGTLLAFDSWEAEKYMGISYCRI